MAVKFPYQSRQVDVVPELSGVVLDAVAGDHAGPDGARWAVETPEGRVEFDAVPAGSSGDGRYRPIRRAPGRLMLGGRSTAVELELLPWSGDRSELALRVAGEPRWRWRNWPRRFTAVEGDAYVRAGDEVLHALVAEMERWLYGFLGGLVDEPAELKAS